MLSFRNNKLLFSGLAALVAFLGGIQVAFSVGLETYAPGQAVTIGDFLYNDDFSPSTDDCKVTIHLPDGSVDVNDVVMSVGSNGWHHYEYTAPSSEGTYPAFMSCGTLAAGDLVKSDKSFAVKAPELTNASIASSVWSSGTRTLTAFGTLAADVWNSAYSGIRRMTDGVTESGGTLATETYVDTVGSSVISEVQTNRSLISALNNVSAADVWSYATRSTNSGTATLDSSSIDGIWNKASGSFGVSGSVGKLIVDNLDAQVSSRGTSSLTAADVWNSATRTLSDYSESSVASAVWGNAARTLTNYGNDITAADVWNVLSSSITATGSIGKQLALNVDGPISDVMTEIQTNRSLISALNNVSAADVWSYGSKSLDVPVDITAGSQSALWDAAVSGMTTPGSIGKKITDNLDAQVSSRGTSSLTAADVWNSATRTLSDYSDSGIADAVWTSAARTLTNYGNDITAADVWNVMSSSLTTVGTVGQAVSTNLDAKSSDILAQSQANAALIGALNNISANDVWAVAGRSLDGPVDVSTASQRAIWDVASTTLSTAGSIGKRLADNIDAQVSSRGTSSLTAADIWTAANRTLTDYGSSGIASAVWANANRTLTNYGNDITAADVWNVLSSTLTVAGSIGQQVGTNVNAPIASLAAPSNWNVRMSNVERVQTGHVYRTKVFVLDSSSQPTTPFAAPVVTVYDADRNIVASGIPMTALSTGVYEYTYTVGTAAAQGLWEVVASTQVESGKTVQTNDYWEVAGSPAQVIINGVTTGTGVEANVTITNEGLTGYEYQYEWCIVSNISNNCGGGDDAFYSMAAKFINPGDSWNTVLTGTAPAAGTYYFKLVVHFGTDSSTASRIFTVASSGGGGGGGGGSSSQTPESDDSSGCSLTADMNGDCRVGSVDLSILLAFWKTKPPYKNPRVDINRDSRVDSIDFSILLSQWTRKKP